MLCPTCYTKTAVLENRDRDSYHYRRRECTGCGFRFSTREMIVQRVSVVKEEPKKVQVKASPSKPSIYRAEKMPAIFDDFDDDVLFDDLGIDTSCNKEWD